MTTLGTCQPDNPGTADKVAHRKPSRHAFALQFCRWRGILRSGRQDRGPSGRNVIPLFDDRRGGLDCLHDRTVSLRTLNSAPKLAVRTTARKSGVF